MKIQIGWLSKLDHFLWKEKEFKSSLVYENTKKKKKSKPFSHLKTKEKTIKYTGISYVDKRGWRISLLFVSPAKEI